MFKRIDHVELVPVDAERTVDFYVQVLGFKLKGRNVVKAPPMKEVIYLELGGTVLEIISVDGPDPRSEAAWEVGYRAIALEVEEMAMAVGYLEAQGVTISKKPVDLGHSLRGEILDPDGLTIELRQWK